MSKVFLTIVFIMVKMCYRFEKFPLSEGLTRFWLLNTGPGREVCTARGVTSQGKDWHVLTAGMEL